MVKRALQENHDFRDSDFTLLLQNFNENFPKLFDEQSTADVLPALSKKIVDSCSDDRLDAYLSFVARTGKTLFEWSSVKNFFEFKVRTVVGEMLSKCPYDEKSLPPNTEQIKPATFVERLLMAFRAFESAPFTVQRLAELLIDPSKHYKKANKFFRALDKNLLVVATVTPEGGRPSLNTPQCEMIVEDQNQAGDAQPPAKMPRMTPDDVVNGESYDEQDVGGGADEPMDVTPAATENIQKAANADVTLASVNIHPNETHSIPSSTEYVELAADHQTNHDEEQSINQEIAQLFWNNNNEDIAAETEKVALEATSTCSPSRNDEISNREKETIDDDNNDNKREMSREDRIEHFTSIAVLATTSADETDGNVAVSIETEVTSSVFSSANQNE